MASSEGGNPGARRAKPRKHPVTNATTVVCAFIILGASAVAQDLQPGANLNSKPAAVPQSTSYSQASSLGDFDLDGDLDAIVTQGGAFFSLQTRLWHSDASTAGVNFSFSDVTSVNLPILNSQSEHINAIDIDLDGDLDLLLSNTTQFFTQSNVWLINQGGLQGGSPGVFLVDQTRWNGLGGAGSSIPSSLLIAGGPFGGGFADWSHYCDFADVDLDGDYDYLQSSVGPSYSGGSMSRLFLNNGLGSFNEYNPSAAVSGASALANGSQAGWVEGSQLDNTLASDGTTHDITNLTYDIDFADIDNDFDLDVVVQNRSAQSRIFQNRFIENALSLGSEGSGKRLFRDVTASALLSAQAGGVCMDFAFGDIDLDDDVDLFATNYASLQDRILLNDGSGVFSNVGSPQGDPGSDENQTDYIDYDGDGDLDVVAADFDGVNYIYKNLSAQGAINDTAATFMKRTSVLGVESELASPGTVANSWLSVGVGDLDNDQDADLIFTQDGSSTSAAIYTNTLGTPDVIAPRIPSISILGGATPANSLSRTLAAQVYENDSTARSREASAIVKFTVSGGPVRTAAARWAGGNIFRGAIPGYWFGNIEYWMEVTDRAGNTGSSSHKFIVIPSAGLSNYGTSTPGCAGAQSIYANSAAAIGNSEFEIHTTHCPQNMMNILLVSSGSVPGGIDPGFGLPVFVDLAAAEVLPFDHPSDAAGLGSTNITIPTNPLLIGSAFFAQSYCYWSGPCTPSVLGLSASNALSIVVQP